MLPVSIPSSGKIHEVCAEDLDCVPKNVVYNKDIHVCDFGLCKVGEPVQMTVNGIFFGTKALSADAAAVDTAWELRVEFINLGQVTTIVRIANMVVVQDNKLQFTAPPSLGQAESTGYRVVVGGQVSSVYRSFACAAGDTTCATNLDAFEKIESDLLLGGTGGGAGETADLIKALDGLSGSGLSVVDPPSLLQVDPKNGPTDGCKEYEPIEIWRERVGAATATEGDPAAAIAKSSDLQRKCKTRAAITLSGLSLGNGAYPSNRLEVWLTNVTQIGSGYKVYNAMSNTACLSVPADSLGAIEPASSGATGGCAHVDNKLIFPAPISPPNYGRNLYFYVVVGGTASTDRVVESKVVGNAFLPWEFAPPTLTGITFRPYDARGASTPGSSVSVDGNLCSIGDTYVDPSPPGCELEMQGRNFGGSKSDVNISIGTKKCLNPEWRAAHPEDGLPYLRCRPQEDVVGAKDATIAVAAQSQLFPAIVTNPKASWFRSACRNGRSAAAQLEVSASTNEDGESGPAPELVSNYFGRSGELCVKCPKGAICTTPVASGSKFTYADPISEKNFFRTTLNITSKPEEAAERCDPKRIPTTELLAEFADLEDKGFCFNFLGCRPKESCLGNNKCKRGYEHVKHKCGQWQKKFPTKNTCKTDRDCRTRSGRTWDGNIEENCGLSNSEDCAVCDMSGTNSTGTGTCTCSQPRRCSLCTRPALDYFYPSDPTVEVEGFFRLDGICEECPKNPIVLFVFFFIAIFFLLIGGFILSQKEFNVAFISIGVDYFQVLSILRSARVEWPSFLKALLQIFSIFNLDIDVTAPECMIPEFTYEIKWWVSIALPFASGVMLLLFFAVSKALNLCVIERHKTKFTLSALISMMLLIIYYVYLMVTRRALELLNCNPASPDDGHFYTEFTDLECDGGFCRCWENDSVYENVSYGVQQRLYPWAIFVLFAFTLGFPLLVAAIVFSNLDNIKIDQILRAYDVSVDKTASLDRIREGECVGIVDSFCCWRCRGIYLDFFHMSSSFYLIFLLSPLPLSPFPINSARTVP